MAANSFTAITIAATKLANDVKANRNKNAGKKPIDRQAVIPTSELDSVPADHQANQDARSNDGDACHDVNSGD